MIMIGVLVDVFLNWWSSIYVFYLFVCQSNTYDDDRTPDQSPNIWYEVYVPRAERLR